MGTPRHFLEPSWSIQRAGCYELLAIEHYTGRAATTTYDCLCLRCGARHVLERRYLMSLVRSLRARLGRKGIKYWLQVHGTCPKCPTSRAPSPATAEKSISRLTFFRHMLDAHGLQILIVSSSTGTVVQITDAKGSLAELERVGKHRDRASARMLTRGLEASCSVESALGAFLKWADQEDFTTINRGGRGISLRYGGAFGGPGELRV